MIMFTTSLVVAFYVCPKIYVHMIIAYTWSLLWLVFPKRQLVVFYNEIELLLLTGFTDMLLSLEKEMFI